MKSMKITTWNVNSLRVRLPHVLKWAAETKPDVLALQELKMPDEDFPHDAVREAGYDAVVSGQRTYNGVAMLIKSSLKHDNDIVKDLPGIKDPQRRVLAVTVEGIRIINLYIPNGESVGSEKYQYKLNWLKQLDKFLKNELSQHKKCVVLGDFNIAPEDIDVYDPARWQDSVLFSPPEREAFQQLLKLGFSDCFRELNPEEQAFSWWDYRMNAFKRKMGLRIDHILASQALAAHCKECLIDKAPRGWERPSDHTPVTVVFSF